MPHLLIHPRESTALRVFGKNPFHLWSPRAAAGGPSGLGTHDPATTNSPYPHTTPLLFLLSIPSPFFSVGQTLARSATEKAPYPDTS